MASDRDYWMGKWKEYQRAQKKPSDPLYTGVDRGLEDYIAWEKSMGDPGPGGGAPAPGPGPGPGPGGGGLNVSGNVTLGGGPGSDAMVGLYRDIADPFHGQRAGYQQKLSDLMTNPGAMTSSPMYQFAQDQGMEAVNRTAAAKGMLGSGNRLSDLTKFGQGLASQQFFPMANLLSGLAGANIEGGGAALGGLVNTRGQDLDFTSSLARTNALGNEGYWNYMSTKDTNASNKSMLQLQQELEERNKLFDENQRRDKFAYQDERTNTAIARASRNKMTAV